MASQPAIILKQLIGINSIVTELIRNFESAAVFTSIRRGTTMKTIFRLRNRILHHSVSLVFANVLEFGSTVTRNLTS